MSCSRTSGGAPSELRRRWGGPAGSSSLGLRLWEADLEDRSSEAKAPEAWWGECLERKRCVEIFQQKGVVAFAIAFGSPDVVPRIP